MSDPGGAPDDREESNDGGGSTDDELVDHPIDGNAVVLATAKASVGPGRMRDLLVAAESHVADRREAYRRRYEVVHEGDGTLVFLAPEGHWADVGAELGITDREADALRRAHAEHLRRLGSVHDRREEFEHALGIREAVVVGTD